MLLKSCGRCGNLIPYGAAYCSTCLPIVQAEREARIQEAKRKGNRKYNSKRDPKYVRFYNSPEWLALSAKRLQDDGYRCVMCGKIATEVDHIIEIKTPEGWEKRLDYYNTRSLCHECHDKRHNRFKRKKIRPKTR
ncbi:HNH endonuclease [Lacrimispora saccharolytica]|nr:HNH endonuclease [Lacrimispora saccharolytica]